MLCPDESKVGRVVHVGTNHEFVGSQISAGAMVAPGNQGNAMNAASSVTQSGHSQRRQSEMSYKFQRLREKIRRAIETGELNGKLPGERALARRFHVNAKTLSKALTDLAAEGLLDRSIGRGTYVRGSAPAPAAATGRWLVVCDDGEQNDCTIAHLRAACPEVEVITSVANLRPSFLNQFNAIVNLSPQTPETFLRDLLVRNMPVVGVKHEPRAYSMHAVMPDVTLGVQRLARDLVLAGHRRLGAVEPRGSSAVTHALRQAACRYSPDATVDSVDPVDVAALVDAGVTALVCGSVRDARRARAALAGRGIAVPQQISLVAVGCTCPDAQCSGYFVDCEKIGQAVVDLLKESNPRPVSLGLAGQWVERGTFAPIGAGLSIAPEAPLRVSGVVV